MPKSLWNARERQDLLDRLDRLSPEAKPRWGSMNAPQMLAHLANWMGMANGQLETAEIRLIMRYTPIKQFIIYWMPWPNGVQTAPELVGLDRGDWENERAAVRELIRSYETRDPKAPWPMHPAFGRLTSRAWGVLGYRHTDHHFRQFGI